MIIIQNSSSMKKIATLIGLFLLFAAAMSVSAAGLPARNNMYVNDNASVLNSSELNQLRTDVKAMCDFYQYQIAVCIVPSLNGMSLDDYAAAVGQKWGVTNAGDNGLLMLIKPKSGSEKGEAQLLTSSDLAEKLPPSILKKILQQEMLPHLRNNEYYNSIEAALEYLNNLPQMQPNASTGTPTSNDYDDYSNTQSTQDSSQRTFGGGFMKWILLALGAIILISLFRKMKGKLQNSGMGQRPSADDTTSNTPSPNQKPNIGRQSSGNSYTPSNTNERPNMGGRPNMGERPNIGGGRPNMGERPSSMPYSNENTYSDDRNQSKEDMIREMEAQRRSMSNERQGSSYAVDLDSGLPQDMEDELKQYFTGSNGAIDEKTLEEMLKRMASRQGNGTSMFDMAKKALKVAMSVGAGVVVFRMLKKIIGASSDPNDDGGLLGKILKGNKGDDDNTSTSSGTKPNLGGKKPNLGGKSGEGSSASVSW